MEQEKRRGKEERERAMHVCAHTVCRLESVR